VTLSPSLLFVRAVKSGRLARLIVTVNSLGRLVGSAYDLLVLESLALQLVSEQGIGAARTLWLSTTGLCLAFGTVLALPADPRVGMAAFAVWSMLGMTFYAPQQKRLIELAPELRNLLLAMNASALYVGMSAGAADGPRPAEPLYEVPSPFRAPARPARRVVGLS
jgi:predicted MFS family arabinose efflux permease